MIDRTVRHDTAGTSKRFSLENAVKQAYTHWNARNVQQAEEISLRVLSAAPDHPGALNLLSLISYSRGQLDRAISQLQKACMHPKASPLFFANLGEMLRQNGQQAAAEAPARRAVELEGKLAGPWNNLGIILQELGKLDESRACLERAVAIEPRNAQAHNNLANTYKRLGQLSAAEEHWKRAIALRADYAEPYSNLSILHVDQGEADKGVAAARKAISINPRLADAYVNLSSAEAARSNHQQALKVLDALANFAPNHPAGLVARANALKNLDRVEEALQSARQAVAIAPQSGEAQLRLGQMFQLTGNFDEALAAYDRAAQLPGNARERALIDRAVLYMEHGRNTEAKEAFERVVTEFPYSASGWFNRADLVKFRADDTDLKRMEAALNLPDRSHTDIMLLNFALGKAWLDIGESANAFKYLNEGNRLKRETIEYIPEQTSRAMVAVAEVFSKQLLDRPRAGGVSSERPVFIVGMPRSGTTLVEQILASHSEVFGAGELRHLQQVADAVKNFPQSVAELSDEQLKVLGEKYLSKTPVRSESSRYVIDKMPANFFHLGLIRLILPGARVIHVRRDPVDTCLSCYSKLFQSEQNFSYRLDELGKFYIDYQKLMEHWRGVLPETHFIEVDYEAVVRDVEFEARRLLAFLDLSWDPACLEFYKTERSVRTASVNQVRQPVYKSSSGRWRQHEVELRSLIDILRS